MEASSRGASSGNEATSGYHCCDEILCPVAPDLARVYELRLVFADDDQDRCGYAAPSSAIIGIVLAIEVKARAVVGAHGRDRRRCERPAIRLTAVRIDGIGTTCPRIEDVLQEGARAASFEPSVAMEGGDIETQLGLVSAGVGISLQPASFARLGRAGVAWRQLAADAPTTSSVQLAWCEPPRTPLIASTLKIAHDVVIEQRIARSTSSKRP